MLMTRKYVILKNDSDSASIITKLERCINDIKAWSSANDLKLNEDKTEVIHVTSRFRKLTHLLLPGIISRRPGLNIIYTPLKHDDN